MFSLGLICYIQIYYFISFLPFCNYCIFVKLTENITIANIKKSRVLSLDKLRNTYFLRKTIV